MKKIASIILPAILAASAMAATYNWPTGSTSKKIYFMVRDPNGDPNTAVNVADLDFYYLEEGAAISGKADVTGLVAADSAWSSGKGFNCGHGLVRLDVPNAALDGAVGSMVLVVLEDQTGATDDGTKDKIRDVTIQLGATVDIQYWKGTAVPDSNVPGEPSVTLAHVDDGNDIGLPHLTEYALGIGSDGSVTIGDVSIGGQTAIQGALTAQGYTTDLAAQIADINDIIAEAIGEDFTVTVDANSLTEFWTMPAADANFISGTMGYLLKQLAIKR
jgi:hypothetical protein